MDPLEHILISMDLSEMDDSLIRYGDFLVEQFSPKSVTFLHVMQSYDISPEILAEFPHLEESVSQVVQEELEEKIGALFTRKDDTKTLVRVEEGVTTDTIIRYTRENQISLTLMGKKIGYAGKGGVVRKVISLIPSSVLLISETTFPRIQQVLVRMDFSRISNMALRVAMQIGERTGASLSCHHVHKLPLKYFPQSSPESDEKLLNYVEKFGLREYNKFLKRYKWEGRDIPNLSTSVDPGNEEADLLYRKAVALGVDLIVIGSKVKSELADILIDTTSEKLASSDKNLPVLIVKDRKQTLGFLTALFKHKS